MTVTDINVSLADQILGADDITRETLEVPEWGVTIELRSPDGDERAALMARWVKFDDDGATRQNVPIGEFYPLIIITCAYDPATGERLFTMDDGTIGALNRKNGVVLERVAQACMRVSGMAAEAVEEGKDVSSTTPNGEPPTG